MNLPETDEKSQTLCDDCDWYTYQGVVVWGREPNETEKRLNQTLKEEGKDEHCAYFDRYFNKSFKKRKRKCEVYDNEEER